MNCHTERRFPELSSEKIDTVSHDYQAAGTARQGFLGVCVASGKLIQLSLRRDEHERLGGGGIAGKRSFVYADV